MIIELQQHAEAVARHLQTMIAAETTQSLRGFTEDNFGVSGVDIMRMSYPVTSFFRKLSRRSTN